MKWLLGLSILILSVQAMGRDIPEVASIDWKCEEGVGNLENPAVLLTISGEFETAQSREFTLSEKQRMKVAVYVDGKPVVLDPAEYNLVWENDDEFQSLLIQTDETTYRIETTPGNALLLQIKSPGRFWGTNIQVGSC